MTVQVDYLHTSRRPQFADLPADVRALLAEVAGSPVASARPSVTSGFTGAFAALLDLADGRRVFAKAAGPAAPHARVAIPQEALVLGRLERFEGRLTAPALVGAAGLEDWQVVVVEAIDGRMPGVPWTDAEVDVVHDACLRLAAVPPEDVAALTPSSLAADVGGDEVALTTLDELAAGRRDWPESVPPVRPELMREVARLGHLACRLLEGDRLVHCDLRPDNLLLDTAGQVRIVDWNWVTRGPAWTDFVSLWPLMARDGIDVDRLCRESPLTRDTEPEAIDAFLAVLAGYLLSHAGNPAPPATLNAIRDHQRLLGRLCLDLLAQRRGWAG
ncbi:phosphotransferase family protein [Pedococcus soli]